MDTPKKSWRDNKPPTWYTNLPKWLQPLVGLAIIAAICGVCGYGVVLVNRLPDPTPAPTAVPSATPTTEPSATSRPADTPEPTARPSATPDVEAAVQALTDWMTAFNTEAGQVFFRRGGFVENGTRCKIVVEDTWYALELYVKERLLEQAAEQCANTARIYLDRADITTSLYSLSDKEVAYKSPLRTKIIE